MKEKKTITGHDNKHAKKDKKKIDPSQAGVLGKARSKQIFRGEGGRGRGARLVELVLYFFSNLYGFKSFSICFL